MAERENELEELSSLLEFKAYRVPICSEIDAGTPLQIRKSITYVVAGVCIEDGKVLLMQEAKESCRGRWYLPAGRMEPGESIEQGCVREVLEETGLQVQPLSLIMVEAGGGRWMRFTFYCRAVGGELKSAKRADKESLQAGWFDLKSYAQVLQLRPGRITPLIDRCCDWLEKRGRIYLPGSIPYNKLLIRIVCVSSDASEPCVLLNGDSSLPVFAMGMEGLPQTESLRFLTSILNTEVAGCCEVVGLLNVDHRAGSDGCCLTLAVHLSEHIPHERWRCVTDKGLKKKLQIAMTQAIPLERF